MIPRRPETGRVHLDILGQTHVLELPVELGPVALSALLPAARALADGVGAIVAEHAAKRGEHPSCAARCVACCRQLIPISVIEAAALARLVDRLPEPRRGHVRERFDAALRRMRSAGLYDPTAPAGASALAGASWDDVSRRYFTLHMDCPLLEDGLCSVYEDRPMPCRQYVVTTPASWCAELDERVVALERPVRMSEALADAAVALVDAPIGTIPLALALAWADEHAPSLDREVDGERAFLVLMEAAQKSND